MIDPESEKYIMCLGDLIAFAILIVTYIKHL